MKRLNLDLARFILIEEIGATSHFIDQEPFKNTLAQIIDGTISAFDYDKTFNILFSDEYKDGRFSLLSEIIQKMPRLGTDPDFDIIFFRANNLVDQSTPVIGKQVEQMPQEYKIRI